MNLKKIKKLFVIVILSISCKNEKGIAQTSLYDLALKSYEDKYLKNEGFPSIKYILDKTIDSTYYNKRLFVKKQFKKYLSSTKPKSITISSDSIKSKNIISKIEVESWYPLGYSDFWEKYKNKYGASGYYKISEPFFSVDKKSFLIVLDVTYFKLGTTSFYMIFNNKEGYWKLDLIKSDSL